MDQNSEKYFKEVVEAVLPHYATAAKEPDGIIYYADRETSDDGVLYNTYEDVYNKELKSDFKDAINNSSVEEIYEDISPETVNFMKEHDPQIKQAINEKHFEKIVEFETEDNDWEDVKKENGKVLFYPDHREPEMENQSNKMLEKYNEAYIDHGIENADYGDYRSMKDSLEEAEQHVFYKRLEPSKEFEDTFSDSGVDMHVYYNPTKEEMNVSFVTQDDINLFATGDEPEGTELSIDEVNQPYPLSDMIDNLADQEQFDKFAEGLQAQGQVIVDQSMSNWIEKQDKETNQFLEKAQSFNPRQIDYLKTISASETTGFIAESYEGGQFTSEQIREARNHQPNISKHLDEIIASGDTQELLEVDKFRQQYIPKKKYDMISDKIGNPKEPDSLSEYADPVDKLIIVANNSPTKDSQTVGMEKMANRKENVNKQALQNEYLRQQGLDR